MSVKHVLAGVLPTKHTTTSVNFTSQDILKEDEIESKKFSYKLSWFLQSLIRRWEFPLFNIIFSLWFWHHYHLFGDPAVMWNQVYSLMAIVVESIVGIGMWAQSNRDAKVLRYIAYMFQLVEKLLEKVLSLEETNKKQLEHLEAIVDKLNG